MGVADEAPGTAGLSPQQQLVLNLIKFINAEFNVALFLTFDPTLNQTHDCSISDIRDWGSIYYRKVSK